MSFIGNIIRDFVATFKNAVSIGETSKEGRTIVSIIISLVFFFTFLSITGDLLSAACLTAGLEVILLYMLSIL